MVRILMINFMFHPIVGGAEKQAEKLSKCLRSKNIKITTITARIGKTKKKEIINGVMVNRLFAFWWTKGTRRFCEYVFMLTLFMFLVRNRNKYDIIHCANTTFVTFISVFVSKLLKKKVITKMGREDCFDYELRCKYLFGNIMTRFIKKNVNKIIVIDNASLDSIRKEKISEKQIVMIPNGVYLPEYEKPERKKIIRKKLNIRDETHIVTCIARFRPEKGHDVLLQAWRDVLKIHPNSKLLLIGSGERLLKIQNMAASLNIANSITFTGSKENVQEYLNITDIFVLPSFIEGLSNSLLEAMATGLPCIATNVGGNKDLINNGINGILVEPGDSEKLAKSICDILVNKKKMQLLGNGALAVVKEKYDFDKISDRYINLYKSLMG